MKAEDAKARSRDKVGSEEVKGGKAIDLMKG